MLRPVDAECDDAASRSRTGSVAGGGSSLFLLLLTVKVVTGRQDGETRVRREDRNVLTYEYECLSCGKRFELEQRITEHPLERCPTCQGQVRRLVAGGTGFVIRGSRDQAARHSESAHGCSYEQTGTTCCGRNARCDTPGCGNS